MKMIPILVLAIVSIMMLCCQIPSNAQNVIFEKALPDERKLLMLSEDVPYKPPSEEMKANLARKFPGTKYLDIKPTHVNAYSLT